MHRNTFLCYIVIYIPLCLYLYLPLPPDIHQKSSFTFHYVYIYMSNKTEIALAVFRFTFHYVYIYMISRYFSTPDTTVNLHSTMFIFIFVCVQSRKPHLLRFTFHYVYIYIIQTSSSSQIFLIYIPLCLYLYKEIFVFFI